MILFPRSLMYNILCWNARGVGNRGTSAHIKDLCFNHKIEVLVIIEPKISAARLDQLALYWGFDNSMHGDLINNHIWVCWSKDIHVENPTWTHQHITVTIFHDNIPDKICYSFIHASCSLIERQLLWDDLSILHGSKTDPWILMGDFNAFLSWDEKQGGNKDDPRSMLAFNDFITLNNLFDAGYSGNDFTWSNNQSGSNRIWERLDRVILNNSALMKFPRLIVHHLEKLHSDHRPITLSLGGIVLNHALFTFQKGWTTHPLFHDFVASNWPGSLHPNPLINFGMKLKTLRNALRHWNWNVFGNLETKLRHSKMNIDRLESELQRGWNNNIADELATLKGEFEATNNLYLDLLKAKAKLAWVSDGDRNSKFFHTAIRVRRRHNFMSLRLGDDFTTDRDVIGAAAVDFYKELFNGVSACPEWDNFNIIAPNVTEDDNLRLSVIPDEAEIHDTIWNMKDESSPGPDGFTGCFYKACWSIIKTDLTGAIQCFFRGIQLPQCFTATYLTLIPKIKSPTAIAQLRPISLCNFCHKIISRIITYRLNSILPKLISVEQVGFVPGRSIHDNISLAHDLTHDLHQKTNGGNVIIKLDMAKAYDRISWMFILRMLRSFGFSHQVCDIIYRNISNCYYSVKWDGKVHGYFKSNRGVRQGDPLSPTLFVLAMEWFSRALNGAVEDGLISPYATKKPSLIINHLMFADDILLFTNGNRNSINNLKSLIDEFCTLSGQNLNAEKCSIIFSDKITSNRRRTILSDTGFREDHLPLIYLGVPLFRGRPLVEYFTFLEDNIKDRIQGWARKYLSMAGRVTLVNSVLNTTGIHSFMVLPVPKKTIDRIKVIIGNFIWNSGSNNRRHWANWETLSKPWASGGLGIRDPQCLIEVLHGKLAWNFIQQKSLWAKFAKLRFSTNERGSAIWNEFHHLIDVIRENSSWIIGNGSITVDDFGWTNGINFSSEWSNLNVRNIIENNQLKGDFLPLLPPRTADKFANTIISSKEDRYAWDHSESGFFSTKIFWEFRATKYASIDWCGCIWKPYIPPKVAFFIWKLFHNVVPTDDVVMRLRINMVSKCWCCHSPTMETSKHLFFMSDNAMEIWGFLAAAFHKQKVFSLAAFKKVWLLPSSKKFMDRFATSIACIALWELWKGRNAAIHENVKANIKQNLIRWGPKIARITKGDYQPSLNNALSLSIFGVKEPHYGHNRLHFINWTPSHRGDTLNVAFANNRFSAIVRDNKGRWRWGFVVPWHEGTFEAFAHAILSSVLQSTQRSLNIREVQCSHFYMGSLSRLDEQTPTDHVQIARWCRAALPNIKLSAIIPLLNASASALAFTGHIGEYPDISNLPKPVRRTLLGDSLHCLNDDTWCPANTSRDDSYL